MEQKGGGPGGEVVGSGGKSGGEVEGNPDCCKGARRLLINGLLTRECSSTSCRADELGSRWTRKLSRVRETLLGLGLY